LRLHFGNHTYATLLRLPNYPSAIAVLGPFPRTSHQKSRITLTARPKKECAPVLLVGASFGGFSIRIFAFEYSERAAGLVLVDAAHEDQGARYAAAGAPEEGIWYARVVPAAAFLGGMRIAGNSLINPEELSSSLRRYAHPLPTKCTCD